MGNLRRTIFDIAARIADRGRGRKPLSLWSGLFQHSSQRIIYALDAAQHLKGYRKESNCQFLNFQEKSWASQKDLAQRANLRQESKCWTESLRTSVEINRTNSDFQKSLILATNAENETLPGAHSPSVQPDSPIHIKHNFLDG
jgi:hypothetical protein